MDSFFNSNDPFTSAFASSSKKLIFQNNSSQNITNKKSFSLNSPNKLNMVHHDWNDENSFVSKKDELEAFNNKANNVKKSPTKRRTLKKTVSTSTIFADRFIPSQLSSSSGKLFGDGELEELELDDVTETLHNQLPLPTDSPTKHMEFQSSKIYKHSMAQVCGIDINQKILQFQPNPPERTKSYNFKLNRNLNEGLNNVLENSRMLTNSITPTNALARIRSFPTIPQRILDAPGLQDDYYLNLMSWSSDNLLAIALENSVYIWQASVGSVNLLPSTNEDSTLITSVSWSEDGSYLSIGKDNGTIEVWDIESNTKLRTMKCFDTRIASHDWSNHLITTGSKIGELYHNDVRISSHVVSKLQDKSHVAEICGIKWRNDGNQLATGGNDNVVNIWDNRSTLPLFTKKNHTAAVKALSWCQYQSSLLATGGGTNDKFIHFWNTNNGSRINSINTGSQITSLNWGESKGTGLEIVATTGFPNNSISVYQYPTLQKTGEINNSHEGRILNSCLSPDNSILATCAADENLKFWKIFDINENKLEKNNDSSALMNGGKQIRRVMTIR